MIPPEALDATCRCGHELYAERGGDWTLKAKILRFKAGGVEAKCPECGNTVPVRFLAVVQPPPATRRRVLIVCPDDGAP